MQRMIAVVALLACSTALAQSAPAPARGGDDSAPSDAHERKAKPTVSESIVVSATRSERSISDLPVSTTVVSAADVKAAPALVADDLLRTIPGVHLPLSTSTNTFFGAETVSMRGLGGSRALVMVDGIPMHEPYYGTVVWQKIPLDSVRQIEVVRGGNASLFGNFALGGTINLLTRPVTSNEVRADVSYGSASTQRQSATVDQRLNSAIGLRLSHTRFNTNGVYRILVPGPIDVPAWNDSSITTLRADYDASERASGFVKASYSKVDLSAGTALSYSNYDSYDLATGYSRAIGGSGLLSATLFHERETLGIGNTTVVGARQSEFLSALSDIPVRDTGASLEFSRQRGGPLAFYSVGVDLRRTDANEKRKTISKTGAVTQQDVVGGHQKFAGLYGQLSWRPSDRLEVLTSSRIDYFDNRGDDVVVGGSTTTYPSTTKKVFDPRVSFRYELAPRSALRGAVYRAFKAPALRELYRNSQTPTSTAVANPYLGPETLVGADLGIEWATSRAHMEVNLYRSVITGLLTRVRLSDVPARSTTQNVGNGRSQGVEVIADVTLARRLSLRAGYTYADSKILENAGDPTLVGKSVENVVPHIGSLTLRYRGDGGTTFDARYRVLSRSWGEAVNLVPVPAHRVLDLSASHPVNRWLSVYGIAENVLNEQYIYVISATNFRPAETRTVSWGVRVNVPTRR